MHPSQSEEPQLILYGLERSVYTRIARLALEEKSAHYILRETEIFGSSGAPRTHLDRHPFGRIPVLEHSGFRLYETAAITRYVDEAIRGPSLQPDEPRARARMNQIIGILDAYAYFPMIWGVFVQRVTTPREGGRPDEELVARSTANARTCLDVLSDLMRNQLFLAGGSITLADIHAAPMLSYFALTPEGAALLAERDNLARWLAAMQERPSVVATRTSLEIVAPQIR